MRNCVHYHKIIQLTPECVNRTLKFDRIKKVYHQKGQLDVDPVDGSEKSGSKRLRLFKTQMYDPVVTLISTHPSDAKLCFVFEQDPLQHTPAKEPFQIR